MARSPNSIVAMTLGAYDWSTIGDFPEVSRTVDWERPDPQGPAIKKLSVSLSGFFIGNSHTEIIEAYQSLIAALNSNDLSFTYSTHESGGDAVFVCQDQLVYLESYDEPEDWKQFDGTYNIKFYYFDAFDPSLSTLDITLPSFNGFSFPTLPTFARTFAPNRDSHRDETSNGTTVTVSLKGFFTAANHDALHTLITSLETALLANKGKGTLVYGDFVQTCRVTSYNIPPVVPRTQAYYEIEFKYDIGTVVKMTVAIEYSRTHFNPRIKEQPFCGTRIIQLLNASGQYVTYSFSVSAADMATARTQLATEVAARYVAGGTEMPGGSEKQDENNTRIDLTFIKFYNIPILGNLPNTST